MYRDQTRRTRHGLAVAIPLLGLALALVGGCNQMDDVTIPELSGPSELALSVRVQATPDVITADGYSTSAIEAVVRDQNGQRVQGREMLFAIADESGNFADIGTLETPSGGRLHAGTATVTTNADGVAYAVYRAPERTDATANQSVLIMVRPVTDDFNGALTRSVRIELKSAEPRLFPQVDSDDPVCNWAVEAPGGFYLAEVILFQSTSYDPDGVIIRYDWDFGDGTKDDKPDVAHAWNQTGDFTVTHVVTDDDGHQAACAATLTIALAP